MLDWTVWFRTTLRTYKPVLLRSTTIHTFAVSCALHRTARTRTTRLTPLRASPTRATRAPLACAPPARLLPARLFTPPRLALPVPLSAAALRARTICWHALHLHAPLRTAAVCCEEGGREEGGPHCACKSIILPACLLRHHPISNIP